MVHVTNLDKDYFKHDPVGHRLVGERTGKIYQLSDKVEVRVTKVDLESRKIELELANPEGGDELDSKPKRKKRKVKKHG